MAKPALFAKVLGMPKLKTLIEDIEDLLVAINSGKFVDVEKCQKKCDSILDFLASDPDLSWNITSPSVHVITLFKENNSVFLFASIVSFFQILLHHSPSIIEFFQQNGFPISKTSEEGTFNVTY